MNSFLQQLSRALQKQAIDELAFRGYLSPRTLEALYENRACPPAAVVSQVAERCAPLPTACCP